MIFHAILISGDRKRGVLSDMQFELHVFFVEHFVLTPLAQHKCRVNHLSLFISGIPISGSKGLVFSELTAPPRSRVTQDDSYFCTHLSGVALTLCYSVLRLHYIYLVT